MREKVEGQDEEIQESLLAQTFLREEIAKHERFLRYVYWIFLASIILTIVGVLMVYLTLAHIPLFTFLTTEFFLGESQILVGGFFAFCGLFFIAYSIHARRTYPTVLHKLRGQLKQIEEDLSH